MIACWPVSWRHLVPLSPPYTLGKQNLISVKESNSALQGPQAGVASQEHREGLVPCSSGSEPSPGRGASVLAGKDLWSWLWNWALFTYPVWRASETRTCKSDNSQEKASSSWFVKRRPWAIVLSAIHRSLESMELWLQLHHRESGSYYLDCGKLQSSNNVEGNCFILGFVKVSNWDQVHWPVLNCCWFLRTLERVGGQQKEVRQKLVSSARFFLISLFSQELQTDRRSLSFLKSFQEWNKQLMGAQRLCFWWNQKWSTQSRVASIQLQLNHWLPEGNSPSVF